MKVIRNSIIVLLIVGIAAVAATVLYRTKPRTKKIKPKAPIPLVASQKLVPGNEKIYIDAFGTVVPARKIDLLAEIEGRIIDQNPELVPGGLLGKGAFVIQIDPTDYQLKVGERKAEVAEAESLLELEKGQQDIASRELQLFKDESDFVGSNRHLILREPQLKNALARLDATANRLAAAELAVKRSRITAPFNSLVLEKYVELGQLIGRQTPIATI